MTTVSAASTLYGATNTLLERGWITALPGEKDSTKSIRSRHWEKKWLNKMAAKGLRLISVKLLTYELENTLPGEYHVCLQVL